MQLLFPYFAFLLVHSYTLTVTAAIPVSQITTVISRTHERDLNQIRTPAKPCSSKFVNLSPRHTTSSLKRFSQQKSEENEEQQEKFRPCKISDIIYRHKEQIPRTDPCEICVCVDSEMYCFWKICTFSNLTTDTPATSAPSNASLSKHETTKQSVNDNNIILRETNGTETKANKIETTDEKFSKILKDQRKYNALKKLEATSPKYSSFGIVKNQNFITSTEKPTICYVMGVVYKYGEVLPRDTGTCLECACSEGGRITCSPKDCVSQPDLDYLSHNNNLDMFDLDTF